MMVEITVKCLYCGNEEAKAEMEVTLEYATITKFWCDKCGAKQPMIFEPYIDELNIPKVTVVDEQ
jgi:hypothetical protein